MARPEHDVKLFSVCDDVVLDSRVNYMRALHATGQHKFDRVADLQFIPNF